MVNRTLLNLCARDILNGLFQTGRYAHLLASIPENVISDLEDDATDAGIFVCQILAGDAPEAFEGLTQDIVDEAEDEFASLTSFILGIPTLAPEIIDDLVQDGEDVVSVIGELFTDPGAALSAIGGFIETIGQDIETAFQGVGCDLGFGCPPAATTGTIANTGLAVLESSCSAILANAAPASLTAAAASSTVYTTAAPSTTYFTAASSSIYSAAASSTMFSSPTPNTATTLGTSTIASPSVQTNSNDGAANSSICMIWLWLAPLAIVMGLMMLL